jgi:hypothetical protein
LLAGAVKEMEALVGDSAVAKPIVGASGIVAVGASVSTVTLNSVLLPNALKVNALR